jgi:hypothetical protein
VIFCPFVIRERQVHAQITVARDELQCRGVLGRGFIVTAKGGESDAQIGAGGYDLGVSG